MRSLFVGIIAAAALGCSGNVPQAQRSAVELPLIPADVRPDNGSVVEYWPNGKTRSERLYAGGHVQAAVYYASDGTLVFEMEMSEDRPEVSTAGR